MLWPGDGGTGLPGLAFFILAVRLRGLLAAGSVMDEGGCFYGRALPVRRPGKRGGEEAFIFLRAADRGYGTALLRRVKFRQHASGPVFIGRHVPDSGPAFYDQLGSGRPGAFTAVQPRRALGVRPRETLIGKALGLGQQLLDLGLRLSRRDGTLLQCCEYAVDGMCHGLGRP